MGRDRAGWLAASVTSAFAMAAGAWAGPPPPGMDALADRPVDPEALAPYVTWDSTPAITMQPLLLDPSDTSVAIEWMTDSASDGAVQWGEGTQLDRTTVAEHDGLVDVGSFHRVVLHGLQPGHRYRYRVVSRRVVAIKPYWPERGRAVRSAVHGFRTLDATRERARFAVITDTHEDVPRIHALMRRLDPASVDFVVHDGDTVDYATDERQIQDVFLAPSAHDLQGRTPLLYVRGNHEYRGPFARALGPYLKAPEGRYDFSRDDGPLHLLVVDTGEDKPDGTNVYAGLDDLADYRRRELARFRAALRAPRTRSAPFTVLLGHQKDFGWVDGRNADWMQAANEAGIDLFIAGHEHRFEHIDPGTIGNRFPILVVGQDQVAKVEATAKTLSVRLTDRSGALIDAFTIERTVK